MALRTSKGCDLRDIMLYLMTSCLIRVSEVLAKLRNLVIEGGISHRIGVFEEIRGLNRVAQAIGCVPSKRNPFAPIYV